MAGNMPAVDIGDNIRRDQLARDPGLFSIYHGPGAKESGPKQSGSIGIGSDTGERVSVDEWRWW